jgi:hypothetical protein
MKRRHGCIVVFALFCMQLLIAAPLFATDYPVSDISLIPGADETQLNIAWHSDTGVDGDTCKVRIAKKGLFWFPSISSIFTGTTATAATDEYGEADYYCEVVVTGLEADTDYVYRLGDGDSNWSDTYEFTTRGTDTFSFFFVADSQIGASAPDSLSASSDIKPYIAEYKLRLDYAALITAETLTDDDVTAIVDAYTGGELADDAEELATHAAAYPDVDLTTLRDDIDALYTAFSDEYGTEGYLTDLAALTVLDSTLADEILVLIEENLSERMTAVEEDSDGWAETLGIMREQFPETAFLLSAGDQVEETNWEYEYTALFDPQELTSLPMAPVIGSHDRAVNFDYHYNLPNESEYAVNDAGGDYYFTYGNTLIMVLNMDATGQLYPKEAPPSDGGGEPPGPPPGEDDTSEEEATDTDGDGVADEDDLCSDTYGESINGCPLTADYDDDADGVTNDADMCNNTLSDHYDAGLISTITGCPYDDVDSDGIPDEDADGITIDRCNNTYDDLTVDEDGCSDCDYLDNEDELATMIYDLENSCETDETTLVETCTDTLADYKISLEEHRVFMEEAIAANPDVKWKIAMWHYSCYSAGMHSTDNELEVLRYKFTPVMEELDIDMVLMGHDHVYTRTYQMLDNTPQTEQTVIADGTVVNPTGILYLTASSSSGSKFYSLNCNVGDDTSNSAVYYDYAASWYDEVRTFTHFTVDDDSLELKTFTYAMGDTVGSYETVLLDEYAILIDPDYQESVDDTAETEESGTTSSNGGGGGGGCFITTASSTCVQNVVFISLLLVALAGGLRLALRKKTNR